MFITVSTRLSANSCSPMTAPFSSIFRIVGISLTSDEHQGAFAPGDGALDHEQVALRVGDYNRETGLGDSLAAHLTGQLRAREHAGGVGTGADGARRSVK